MDTSNSREENGGKDFKQKTFKSIRNNINKLLWRRKSVTITQYDSTYKVSYLGNVLCGWTKVPGLSSPSPWVVLSQSWVVLPVPGLSFPVPGLSSPSPWVVLSQSWVVLSSPWIVLSQFLGCPSQSLDCPIPVPGLSSPSPWIVLSQSWVVLSQSLDCPIPVPGLSSLSPWIAYRPVSSLSPWLSSSSWFSPVPLTSSVLIPPVPGLSS
ncbi:hypothetical protein WDU94_002564 [Cyamophila willieti]